MGATLTSIGAFALLLNNERGKERAILGIDLAAVDPAPSDHGSNVGINFDEAIAMGCVALELRCGAGDELSVRRMDLIVTRVPECGPIFLARPNDGQSSFLHGVILSCGSASSHDSEGAGLRQPPRDFSPFEREASA